MLGLICSTGIGDAVTQLEHVASFGVLAGLQPDVFLPQISGMTGKDKKKGLEVTGRGDDGYGEGRTCACKLVHQ